MVNHTDPHYTIDAWNNTQGQGNQEARRRDKYCVVVNCSSSDAILLSQIFRRYYNLPTACHYDCHTLSMYCGATGNPHELMDTLVTIIKALQLEPIAHW